MLLGQPGEQPPHRLRAGLDLAEVVHVALPARLGDRDRVLRLGRVDPNEDAAFLRHGSSSLR
jgi:hypothetical protein